MSLQKQLLLVRDYTMWGLIDTVLTLIVVLGLALNAWGVVMNALVVEINDGVMPVISSRIEFIMTNYGTPRRFISDGNLLFWADNIRIDFPSWENRVPADSSGAAIRWWVKWLDYPLEGGVNIVSIGDICRWVGSATFLLGLLLLVPCSIRRLLMGDIPRVFK